MGELRRVRCQKCKELYSYESGLPPEMCPKCQEEKEAQAQQLRDLVWENRGITGMELHELTGIPIETVIKHIEDGLLEAAPDEVAMFREPIKRQGGWHSGREDDRRKPWRR